MKFEMAKIGDLCDLITKGTTPTTLGHRFAESGISFVKVESLTEDGQIDESKLAYIDAATHDALKRSQLRSGDILFTIAGTIGRVGKVPDSILPANTNQAVALLRPNPGLLNGDFLLYSLRKLVNEGKVASGVVQAVQANFSLGSIRELALLLPRSVDEQRQVVRVLCLIDSKIHANRRINQTLEAMAQAIFKSWFVDFDPVKAKITAKQEGRDPLRAAMTAISGKSDAELDALPPEQYAQLAATAALFPDEMEQSELGEIPKGWEVSCISQFGDVVCGKTPSKANPEYFGEGIPFIKIPDMHNSMYVVSPSERLTALGAASQAKKTIPSGSICVSCIATVGKVVITHESTQTNQQINSIVPKLSQYTAYLYFQMKEKEKEFHDLASGGSATLNMNTSTFSKVSVLMPSVEILTKFSVLMAPLLSEILLRQKESASLSETRDTLLPKLLSGELSVADVTSEVSI